ncbi:hypothetical protein P7F60_06215 [Rhizobium sp. YJ-22]|uniref:hypothetical protein n=1 Tax=Rhizobium sp. YJ-22 TaxID=3037556 RepID=UPI002412251B|nr:hypothetical protein [Rhizobium sp. YJ-22]MDG3575970.1 hypothetical protein [Rhizobium sp. YJ-22]
MTETPNRNLPLIDPDQPQRDGAARINTALTAVDAEIAALLLALGQKANAADIGPAITAAINALVAGAPAALDTLAEVAAKLAENDDAVAAIMASLATKANAANVYSRATVDGMVSAEAQARADADTAEATARASAIATAVATLTTSINAKAGKLILQTKNTNFAASAGNAYLITAGIICTFPASPAVGDRIGIVTESAIKDTPCTINFAGATFDGATANLVIGVPTSLILEFYSGAWRLV